MNKILVALAVTLFILPHKVYGLSILPPPSDFAKSMLDLLFLLTIVLLAAILLILTLLVKSKKSKSGSKSKFSRLVLKILVVIGALLFIFRLSLQMRLIRDLIDRNYYAGIEAISGTVTTTQEILVGFKKGVSQEKA